MTLVETVAKDCALDEGVAAKALGAVFTSIRMGVDARTFALVVAAFPDCGSWMREAPATTAQTGAMLALATPDTLQRGLEKIGLDADQIRTLGAVVGRALSDGVAAKAFDTIAGRLPFLKG